MTRNEEKIHQLCKSAEADVNLCRIAYSLIENAPKEEQGKLLETFLLCYRFTPSDCSLTLPSFLDEETQRSIQLEYGPRVDQQMMDLQKKGLSEEEYYRELWEHLSTASFLPDLRARVVALFNCAIDRNALYYAVDRNEMLSMDGEQYLATLTAVGEKTLARVEAILNEEFDQKTERASLVVKMMDSMESFEERTVLLAQVISHYQRERLRTVMDLLHERRHSSRLFRESREPLPFGGDDEDPEDE